MARERVNQLAQIGLEATKGTAVAADVKLATTMITPKIEADIQTFRPSGNKFNTVAALHKEWTTASIEGQLNFNEITFFLASLIDNVTPSTASGETTWTFVPTSEGADDPATFTVEYGASDRADELAYGLVTDMTMSFSRSAGSSEASMSGTMIGRALSDDITITGALSPATLTPVTTDNVALYLDNSAANLGNTALDCAFSVEWNLTNRWGVKWCLDGNNYWSEHVHLVPELSITLLLEADDTGMGLLAHMRNEATRFLRVEATGATIDSNPYRMTIDTAVKVAQAPDPFSDQDGVEAIQWNLLAFHDETWGQAAEVELLNELANL